MRGQLPKAYLRIDPNIDQVFPELRKTFIGVLCAANRQPQRGRFRNLAVIEGLFGRAFTKRLIERGDIEEGEFGRWYVTHWDDWQEGDLNVGERVRRFRARHALQAVTEAVTKSLPPSEASRRLGVKALDGSPSGEPPAREDDPWRGDEDEALTWLARHGCDVRPGNGYHRQLVTAVQSHGINAVIGMLDRLEAAGVKHGDTKGYLFGAIDALNARGRPRLADLEKEDRAEERDEVLANRLARTRAYIEGLTSDPEPAA